MPLKGSGFLAIWHDIKAEGELEYHNWHTREHMPERLGVPGFEVGRRWVDWNRDRHRYFTLYEARTIDVFGSEPYRARLNAPSAWSNRVQPHFTNFVRSACRTIVSVGKGIGGAMATIRVNFAPDAGKSLFSAKGHALACEILPLDGVTSVHIGYADPTVTRVHTRESELRTLTGEDVFDAVVMVDGIGRRELERAMARIDLLLGSAAMGVASKESAVYDLAYLLTSDKGTQA
ncbi:MAG: hypothetical protein ACREVG_16930 [Burkholderiales bacterium]